MDSWGFKAPKRVKNIKIVTYAIFDPGAARFTSVVKYVVFELMEIFQKNIAFFKKMFSFFLEFIFKPKCTFI